MATSGTNNFNPSGGELILYALGLCGIRRTAVVREHLEDARMAMNLLLGAWGNNTPNLWTVELVSTPLSPGTATYDVNPNIIMILDAYIRTGEDESQVDRIIWPVSRTEYASFPNKLLQAPPTVFWFDRQLAPQVTLWQVPDSQQIYTLRYYACTTVQDANAVGNQTLDIPTIWLMALAWGIAAQLAASYAPDKAGSIEMKAGQYLAEAREQNTEAVPLYVLPMVSSYYPR